MWLYGFFLCCVSPLRENGRRKIIYSEIKCIVSVVRLYFRSVIHTIYSLCSLSGSILFHNRHVYSQCTLLPCFVLQVESCLCVFVFHKSPNRWIYRWCYQANCYLTIELEFNEQRRSLYMIMRVCWIERCLWRRIAGDFFLSLSLSFDFVVCIYLHWMSLQIWSLCVC